MQLRRQINIVRAARRRQRVAFNGCATDRGGLSPDGRVCSIRRSHISRNISRNHRVPHVDSGCEWGAWNVERRMMSALDRNRSCPPLTQQANNLPSALPNLTSIKSIERNTVLTWQNKEQIG